MSRVLALALLLASPAWAQDCGRFEDPLAYNACLAKQGPTARAARAAHYGAAPVARAARPPANVVVRRGRSEMVFSVRK